MLKLIDTFSGIGGFSLAAEQIVGGFETVAFVECEPYCQKILKKHWPTVPIYDDIRTYKPEPYSADVICGGFPCQDISVAGRGEGITEETRSGLFHELLRVIRLVRPRFVVLENVSAILTNGLDIVLGELHKAGYDAEWACFPASMVGACHQRDRWWAVCYLADPTSFRSRTQGEIQTGGNSFNGSIASNSKSIGMEGMRSSWQQIQPRLGEEGLSKWRYERDLLSPDWRSYSSKPVLRRGDDGLSNRVLRLKSLGNSIVPACAAVPLQRIKRLSQIVGEGTMGRTYIK